MSKYFDGKDLFLEPKVTQHNSHMIMTNVMKETKTKYLNIDTRFRDEYNFNSTANYNITLPQRINDVKKMSVTSVEIPMTIYNISSDLGNNYFLVSRDLSSNMITLSDGFYTSTTLATEINYQLQYVYDIYGLTYEIVNNKSKFSTTTSINIKFDVDSTGAFDKYNIKSKLGWFLGYRDVSYSMNNSYISSNGFVNLNGMRYLYLVIDEFTKGNQNSFVCPMYNSLINKNIIARAAIDYKFYPFGYILHANHTNGLLVTDLRNYTGNVDLQKLNVQLVDEMGNPVNLNGLDFSFCLKIEYE
jgi:hypothetical protein